MKRYLTVFAFVILFPGAIVFAQEENNSKWYISGSIIPHFTSNLSYGLVGSEKGWGISYYYPEKIPIPSVDFKIEYALVKNLSVQAGIGYMIYNTSLLKWDIYANTVEGEGKIDYNIPNANIHILEMPGQVNYYVLHKKYFNAYISLGDVSSFAIAKTYPDPRDYKIQVGQTTIYQNYLQFAFGFEIKAGQQWSYYFSPMYRMAMVNYHDAAHYDIYAYPNVFYERMLGLGIGAKYSFNKKIP